SGRKTRPAVGHPCRGIRPSVHEDRPIQGPHELKVVDAYVTRERILFFENARAAKAAPLVRCGVRSALIFRGSPDGLRGRIGSLAPGIVEWNSEVVAERGLRGCILLVVLETPLTGDVWRILGGGGWGRQAGAEQRRGNEEKGTPPPGVRDTNKT